VASASAAVLTVLVAREDCPSRYVCKAARVDDQATPPVTQIDRNADERNDACFRVASRPSPGCTRRHSALKQQLGRSAESGQRTTFNRSCVKAGLGAKAAVGPDFGRADTAFAVKLTTATDRYAAPQPSASWASSLCYIGDWRGAAAEMNFPM